MLSRGGFLVVGAVLVGACSSAPAPDDEDVDDGSAAATRGSTNLMYEGTCDFLRSCSRFSRGLPRGQVTWGCTGRGACDDDDLWVAGPSRSHCGETVRICRGAQCTTAVVKDVSSARGWEGGPGVMRALGLAHGLHGQCSGYGGGRVTLEVQAGRGADPSEPDLAPTPTPSADPSSPPPTKTPSSPPPTKTPASGGCMLANGEPVDEMTCVLGKGGAWYQCSQGSWYVGGDGSTGAVGPCTSVYGL